MADNESQNTQKSVAPVDDAAVQQESITPFPLNTTLEIHGQKYLTIEAIYRVIKNMPTDTDKKTLMAETGIHLMALQGATDQLTWKFAEMVKETFPNAADQEEINKMSNNSFKKAMKTPKSKNQFDAAIKALKACREDSVDQDGNPIAVDPRTVMLVDYVFSHFPETTGYSAYHNLALLLGKLPSRVVIARLNENILKRQLASKTFYGRRGLSATDCSSVWLEFSKKKEVQRRIYRDESNTTIKLSDLKKAKLVFDPCGILKPGRFDKDSVFPVVNGERDSVPVITVEVDDEALMEPERTVTGGDDDDSGPVNKPEGGQKEGGPEQAAIAPKTPVTPTADVQPTTGQTAETPTPATGKRTSKRAGKEVEVDTPKAKKQKTPKSSAKAADSKYSGGNQSTDTPSKSSATRYSLKRPTVQELNCECPVNNSIDMDLSWLIKVLRFEQFTFLQQREILDPIATYGRMTKGQRGRIHKLPCNRHFKMICDYMHMIFFEGNLEEMAWRIVSVLDVSKDKNSFKICWVHDATQHYFDIRCPEVAAFREKHLRAVKYIPKPLPEVLPKPQMDPTLRDRFSKANILHSDLMFEWMIEPEVHEMLATEIGMLAYHQRANAKPQLGTVSGGYFTMVSQLMYANPLLWVHHFAITGKKWYLAYPQPIVVFEEGKPVISVEYFGGEKLSTSTALHGIFCFAGSCRKELDGKDNLEYQSNPYRITQFRTRSSASKFHKDHLASRPFLNLLEKENLLYLGEVQKEMESEPCSMVDAFPDMAPGEVFLWRDGGILNRFWDHDPRSKEDCPENHFNILNGNRIEIPVSLVAVDSDEKTEGDSTFGELSRCLLDQTKPPSPRFDYDPYPAFPVSVQLQNLGPIWEMVRGAKSFNHPHV